MEGSGQRRNLLAERISPLRDPEFAKELPGKASSYFLVLSQQTQPIVGVKAGLPLGDFNEQEVRSTENTPSAQVSLSKLTGLSNVRFVLFKEPLQDDRSIENQNGA